MEAHCGKNLKRKRVGESLRVEQLSTIKAYVPLLRGNYKTISFTEGLHWPQHRFLHRLDCLIPSALDSKEKACGRKLLFSVLVALLSFPTNERS